MLHNIVYAADIIKNNVASVSDDCKFGVHVGCILNIKKGCFHT